MNSIDAKIRKQQSKLICSGLAVILFGVWSIVRTFLLRFIDTEHFIDFFDEYDMILDRFPLSFLFTIVVILMIIDLLFRIYIGASAINEGMGRAEKKIAYIIVAVIYMILSVSSDITSIGSYFSGESDMEVLLAAVIDMSIHLATLEIIISAIVNRRLKKKSLQYNSL